MSTVLVGFDGSPESRRAARYAVSVARAGGMDVRVVQAVPPLILPSELPPQPTSLDEEQLKWAQREVADEAKELSGTGAKISTRVVRGYPAPELIRMASEDPEVEVVVVGRAGKGAMKRALLGSVSSRLAHACPKPVVIIP